MTTKRWCPYYPSPPPAIVSAPINTAISPLEQITQIQQIFDFSLLESFSRPPFDMAAQTVVLKVGMSCQGCVGAVTRVLNKMEGVESFDVDIKEQKVTVKGNVQPDAVFQTVSKTGKKTEFWPTDAPAAVEPTTAPAEAVAV